MSELAIVAASMKVRLLEISNQAKALATGLHNAAPGEKSGVPNNSVQYLFKVAETLAESAEKCEKIHQPAQGTANKPGM